MNEPGRVLAGSDHQDVGWSHWQIHAIRLREPEAKIEFAWFISAWLDLILGNPHFRGLTEIIRLAPFYERSAQFV